MGESDFGNQELTVSEQNFLRVAEQGLPEGRQRVGAQPERVPGLSRDKLGGLRDSEQVKATLSNVR
jgi:hypothetical protein